MAGGNSILVDAGKLETAAKKISQSMSEYQSSYGKLYAAVDAMDAGWKGTDNQAYISDIKGYKKSFTEMEKFLEATSKFLNVTAQDYRKAQEEVRKAASSIGGGKA